MELIWMLHSYIYIVSRYFALLIPDSFRFSITLSPRRIAQMRPARKSRGSPGAVLHALSPRRLAHTLCHSNFPSLTNNNNYCLLAINADRSQRRDSSLP